MSKNKQLLLEIRNHFFYYGRIKKSVKKYFLVLFLIKIRFFDLI